MARTPGTSPTCSTGSRIVGRAVVGANTVGTGSYVAPFTSIAVDRRAEDSEIEYSIVLRDSSATGGRQVEARATGLREMPVAPPAERGPAERPRACVGGDGLSAWPVPPFR